MALHWRAVASPPEWSIQLGFAKAADALWEGVDFGVPDGPDGRIGNPFRRDVQRSY